VRKLMCVVRPQGIAPHEVHRRCRQVRDHPGVTGWVANVADVSQDPVGGGPPTAEAVVSVYLEDGTDLDPVTLLTGLDAEVYEVDERVVWDRHGRWPAARRAPGFNRVALVPRRAGITRERFADHWTGVHGPLAAAHHPGIARYVQNVVTRRLTPSATDWDGIAELHFLTAGDFTERMYDSPAGRAAIRADVLTFIDPSRGERFLLGRWEMRQPPPQP
jgi:uncharacterized protein (TIGR02118 family)